MLTKMRVSNLQHPPPSCLGQQARDPWQQSVAPWQLLQQSRHLSVQWYWMWSVQLLGLSVWQHWQLHWQHWPSR